MHLVQLLQPMGELLRYVMQLFLCLLVLLSVVGQRSFVAFLVQPSPVHTDTASILTPSPSSYTAAFLDVHYLGLLLYLWYVRVSS